MARLAVVAEERCARCTCRDERDELLRDAVVEAARQLMAAELRLERAGTESESWDRLLMLRGDAWQTLRDCLSAERRSR